MKIIKKGKLPEKRVYRAHCPHCKTIFSFEKHEAKLEGDQRDGDFLRVKCPLCKNDVCISI